jgi:hypothetical protein
VLCVEACRGGDPGARTPASLLGRAPHGGRSWIQRGSSSKRAAMSSSIGRETGAGGVLGGGSCIWLGSAWAARHGSAYVRMVRVMALALGELPGGAWLDLWLCSARWWEHVDVGRRGSHMLERRLQAKGWSSASSVM